MRSLARDLGERLGCGAHLTALRRLWVDPFRAPQMHPLAQLEQIGDASGVAGLDALLLPLEQGLSGLPALHVGEDEVLRLRQGKRLSQTLLVGQPLCRALDASGRLIALVEIDPNGEVTVRRGFNSPA